MPEPNEPLNPYADDLQDRAPLDALNDTPDRIAQLVRGWGEERFERSYAPGKWSARQILIHLAQAELALGTRARFAASRAGYTAQPFSQDEWMPLDAAAPAAVALDAYLALRRMNLWMWRSLPDELRVRPFVHPEFGEISVSWIAAQLAGHDIHHLKQLAAIA